MNLMRTSILDLRKLCLVYVRQNYIEIYICESWGPDMHHRFPGGLLGEVAKRKSNLGWLLYNKLFSKWQIHTSGWSLHVTSAQHLQWIFTSGWRRRITQGGPFSFLQSQRGRREMRHNHIRKINLENLVDSVSHSFLYLTLALTSFSL